ncbi:RWD domain-containing protein 3 isoform X2 [Chiloscyllium plagiosum]|uniref:RWD domain-containing protein 3 isoform X2 n=1 Tax=Chiloscyllium plagiosum TaxID=36176 RepID=UPI001CB80A6C|nr:RWD domain-containing protein 3 isoform X2 [Chiloscyllium plagiosum]
MSHYTGNILLQRFHLFQCNSILKDSGSPNGQYFLSPPGQSHSINSGCSCPASPPVSAWSPASGRKLKPPPPELAPRSMAAQEEVAALGAIYSEDFQLLSESESEGITFQIHTICEHHAKKIQLKVTFHLSPEYPVCLPDISICSDQLNRKQCCDLKLSLMQYADSLLGQPMVYELMMWLQQNFKDDADRVLVDQTSEGDSSQQLCSADGGVWMALLHLDHMRAKAKYIKSIEKWTSDLRLTGRLMFLGKLILILLQGERKDIKAYKLCCERVCIRG